MALENDDLIVVQKSGGGELRKAKVSDIKPDLPPELWTEDSGNLYPTTLTNKVGIGTDSPGSTLDVVSNTQNVAQFVGAAACRIDLAASGTGTDNYLQLMSDEALRWVSGTEKVRIDPDGNVGIGTDSPTSRLQVNETNAPLDSTSVKVLGLAAANAGNNSFRYLNLYAPGVDSSRVAKIEVGGSTAPLTFDVGQEERLRITKDGKIGIGTTLPYSLLDLRTDDQYGGINLRQKTGGAKVAELVGLNTDNDWGVLALYKEGTRKVSFDASTGDNYIVEGNFGLGTKTPAANLEIANSAVEGVPAIYLSESRPATTTSDIAIAGGAVIRAVGHNIVAGENGYFRWMIDPTDDGSKVTDGTDGATEHMRLNSNGYLGIGTISPFGPLTVDCDLEATDTSVSGYSTILQSAGKRVQIGATDTYPVIQAGGTGTSGNLLLNPFQGKVGIGTSIAPARNLTINAGSPVIGLTRNDVENFRIQATSSGIYYDALESQNQTFRWGPNGTSTAMTINGTNGNVACSNDIAAQGNQIRLTTTGTGDNKRGIIQLVPTATVQPSSNVFYVMSDGTATCTISKGGTLFATTYDLESLDSLP